MSSNRRDFLKKAGLIGTGMFGSGISGIFGSSGARIPFNPLHNQKFNMHGYAAPAIEKVRVGVTG